MKQTVDVSSGTIDYQDTDGSVPVVVLLHGLLMDGSLWEAVVAELSRDHRCVVPTLPLGAHRHPMRSDADLSLRGIATLVTEFLDGLGLDDVTLVGNDTGGAICQLVVTRRPERIGRLVLTSCDAFDNFPPKAMQPAMPLLRMPGAFTAMLAPLRLSRVRARVFGSFVKRPIDRDALDSYALPALRDAGVRRDARKFLVGLDKRHTLAAAERFAQFRRPVLIAWSRQGSLFPGEYGERLAQAFPDARLEWIDDSLFLSPEDRPDRVAELIRSFAAERAAV